MPTIRVDNLHILKNEFTSFGHETNSLYKYLNRKGCHHLLERELPDKSRVIIAYPNQESKISRFVIRLNRDGSMAKKTNELAEMLNPFAFIDKVRTITKAYMDETGKQVKEIIKRLSYDVNGKITNRQLFKHTDKYVTHYEYDKYGGRHAQCNRMINNVRESFSKIAMDGSEDQSLYVKFMDGTKNFERHINGTDYFFTTQK